MGVDVVMHLVANGSLDRDDLRVAQHQLYSLFGHGSFYGNAPLERLDELDSGGSEVHEVTLSSRFYDEEYPRGDFRLIHDVAEFLEMCYPEATILYGGDTGPNPEPFGSARRFELRRFWMHHGNRPYTHTKERTPLCPTCEVSMAEEGAESYWCECGYRQRLGIESTRGGRWRHFKRHYPTPKDPELARLYGEFVGP